MLALGLVLTSVPTAHADYTALTTHPGVVATASIAGINLLQITAKNVSDGVAAGTVSFGVDIPAGTDYKIGDQYLEVTYGINSVESWVLNIYTDNDGADRDEMPYHVAGLLHSSNASTMDIAWCVYDDAQTAASLPPVTVNEYGWLESRSPDATNGYPYRDENGDVVMDDNGTPDDTSDDFVQKVMDWNTLSDINDTDNPDAPYDTRNDGWLDFDLDGDGHVVDPDTGEVDENEGGSYRYSTVAYGSPGTHYLSTYPHLDLAPETTDVETPQWPGYGAYRPATVSGSLESTINIYLLALTGNARSGDYSTTIKMDLYSE